jgi:hypothetical protein
MTIAHKQLINQTISPTFNTYMYMYYATQGCTHGPNTCMHIQVHLCSINIAKPNISMNIKISRGKRLWKNVYESINSIWCPYSDLKCLSKIHIKKRRQLTGGSMIGKSCSKTDRSRKDWVITQTDNSSSKFRILTTKIYHYLHHKPFIGRILQENDKHATIYNICM